MADAPAAAATTEAAAPQPQEMTLVDQLRQMGVDLPEDFVLHRMVSEHMTEIPGTSGVAVWRQGDDAPWPRPAAKRAGESDDAFAARAKTKKLYKVILMFPVDGGIDVFCGPREGSAAVTPAVIHLRGKASTLEEMTPPAFVEALQDALLADDEDDEEEDDLLDDAREYVREWVEDIRAIRGTANGMNAKVRAPYDATIEAAANEAALGFLDALDTYAKAAAGRREEMEKAEAEIAAAEAEMNGGANGATHVEVADALLAAVAQDAADDLPLSEETT